MGVMTRKIHALEAAVPPQKTTSDAALINGTATTTGTNNSAAVNNGDPLSRSLNALRNNSALQLRRMSSSASSTPIIAPRRRGSVTSSVVTSSGVSTFGSRRINSRVSPDARSSATESRSIVEKAARPSNISPTSALTEFNIFLKIIDDVAIHYITLYFINVTTAAVITKMELSFTKYYANSQRRLYRRGLLTLIAFMITTFGYDYVVLWKRINITSAASTSTTSQYVGNSKLPKFTIVVALKIAIVLPVLFLTYFRARKHTYAEDFWLTWICVAIVAFYPLAYNKLTDDYGVSWVCLVIMYIYSCTPIRFFQCSVFCLVYLMLYVIVMLAYLPEESGSNSTRYNVSSETLYACLFFLLILLPSQSREFAIRVSYMSELMVLLQQEQLKMEETRSKLLLNSMLPETVVEQLQCGRELIADAYAQTTVLFAEVCDFDFYSSKLKPQQVVELLNILFYKFDRLVDVHHVHKVETIGAVYMVVGGCPDPAERHAELVANLALDMIRCIPEVRDKVARKPWGELVKDINIRVGINSGGLMAGVVGIRNPRFKLFGDTVNVASRMETTNLPGQIQITEATYKIIADNYLISHRGKVFVKGRGEMNTYFLRGNGNFVIPPPPTVVPVSSTVAHAGSVHNSPDTTSTHPPFANRRISVSTMRVSSIPENADVDATELVDNKSGLESDNTEEATALASTSQLFARQPRRLSRQLAKTALSKQKSLVNLLTIAEALQKQSAASLDTQAVVSEQASAMKANAVMAATIATTEQPLPQNQSSIHINERRGSLALVKKHSLHTISSGEWSIFRENIFDIVEEAEGRGDDDDEYGNSSSTEIMKLPKGLTRREVLFRIHNSAYTIRSRGRLTQEAFEFEESYRLENRVRWMRFLRLSMLVFLILKPFMTLYQTLRLTSNRSYAKSDLIFLLNFSVMYPVFVAYLLYTFSPGFRDWEQSTSVFVILIVAVVLCAESIVTNSLGHAYLSVLALYQCYFANISFLLRTINGFTILALYVFTNSLVAPALGWIAAPDQILVGRNALYIFIFFAGQAWVVFNSEFKQRINHYREITLNSQKQKLVEEEGHITKLLLNLLPETIVDKLKEDPEATIADFFDNVTVLFTDMVNFTAYSSKVSAMELVQFLNDMYTRFDTIAEKENLYKVEIIGDAYFVVGGCPIVSTNNALAVVTAATEMFAALPLLRRNCGLPDLNIRIGIHSGPVLAGVVGSKDPRYHLFGETVTIAHFLESSGVPGRIHISENTWARMNKDTPGHGFKVEYHTLLSLNGKKIRTYFIF